MYCIMISKYNQFPGGSDGKEFPAMQETQVRVLGQEDTLEKGMAPHSSILAGRISWTKKPGRLQSVDYTQADMTEQRTHTHTQILMRYFTSFLYITPSKFYI